MCVLFQTLICGSSQTRIWNIHCNELTVNCLVAHFIPLISFYTPWKHEKISDFLTFSGGIERDQWHEMN